MVIDPLQLEPDYLIKLTDWIRKADNGVYKINTLSANLEKFLMHLWYYKERNPDHRYVWIDEVTETEIMYNYTDKVFDLQDLHDIPEREIRDLMPRELYDLRDARMIRLLKSDDLPAPIVKPEQKKTWAQQVEQPAPIVKQGNLFI